MSEYPKTGWYLPDIQYWYDFCIWEVRVLGASSPRLSPAGNTGAQYFSAELLRMVWWPGPSKPRAKKYVHRRISLPRLSLAFTQEEVHSLFQRRVARIRRGAENDLQMCERELAYRRKKLAELEQGVQECGDRLARINQLTPPRVLS